MRRVFWAVEVIAIGLAASAAWAQALPSTSMVQRMINGRVRLGVMSGRLVNQGGWHYGNGSESTTSNNSKEQLTYRGNGATGSLNYERSGPEGQFTFETSSEGRVGFSQTTKSNDKTTVVEFSQNAGEPLSLKVVADGKETVVRGATLWHLFLMEPEQCRKHLLPVLEQLRPQWRLTQTTDAIEAELLKTVAGKRPDRNQWVAMIAQLSDSRYAKREAADRQIRGAGPAILGYLQQLDFAKLDAEQQFRIRRIIASLARQTSDDTPMQVASWLSEDASVWLALLARPEVATRKAAAEQLTAILGEPVPVDPNADPATQKPQREELQKRIEKMK